MPLIKKKRELNYLSITDWYWRTGATYKTPRGRSRMLGINILLILLFGVAYYNEWVTSGSLVNIPVLIVFVNFISAAYCIKKNMAK